MDDRPTVSTHLLHGMPLSIPNQISTEKEDFYISYNNRDIGTYGSDTTALVKGEMEKFYILNGDHRKAYAELADKGFDSCMEYFISNKHLMNKYSEE